MTLQSPGRLTAVAAISLSILVGCTAIYRAFPAVDPRNSDENAADGSLHCSAGDGGKWDLGTGRLEDIVRWAPDFYSLPRGEGTLANRMRVDQLRRATLPEGLTLELRRGNGHLLVEFGGRQSAPGRVVAFSKELDGAEMTGVLLAPETCPHVLVESTCREGRLVTKLTADETLPCFRGRSGTFDIWAPGLSDDETIAPGEVVWLTGTTSPRVALSSGFEKLFQGALAVNSFADATPNVVLGLLEHAGEERAAQAYRQLSPQWATAVFDEQLLAARVARTERLLARRDLIVVVRELLLNGTLPGDAALRSTLTPYFAKGFRALVEQSPSDLGFWRAIVLLGRAPDASALDVQRFVTRYRRAIADGTMEGPRVGVGEAEREFLRRWPLP